MKKVFLWLFLITEEAVPWSSPADLPSLVSPWLGLGHRQIPNEVPWSSGLFFRPMALYRGVVLGRKESGLEGQEEISGVHYSD